MFDLKVEASEEFDEATGRFYNVKAQTYKLEHSLISISKWESKWHKPFLKKGDKTIEETIDYIRCMTLTQNVNPEVYKLITNDVIDEVTAYIDDSMTATWFSDKDKTPPSREVVTAEIIYYWMIALNIPFECQKWHLNRLLTLIKVCNAKNSPPKKRSKREIAQEHAAINAARRKATNAKKR